MCLKRELSTDSLSKVPQSAKPVPGARNSYPISHMGSRDPAMVAFQGIHIIKEAGISSGIMIGTQTSWFENVGIPNDSCYVEWPPKIILQLNYIYYGLLYIP